MQKTINSMNHLTEKDIDKLIAENSEVTIRDYIEIVEEINAISESVKEAA